MKSCLIFFNFLNTALLFGQADQFGVKGGINSSILNGSIQNVRTGLNIGIFYKAHLGKNFYFRTELYYSGQGQFEKLDNSKTETSVRYLNMPFLLEYGKKFSFVIGPQIGLLISGMSKETINGQRVKENLRQGLYDADIGLSLGTSLKISKDLKIGARFNQGFSNIKIASGPPVFRNAVLQVYLEFALISKQVSLK